MADPTNRHKNGRNVVEDDLRYKSNQGIEDLGGAINSLKILSGGIRDQLENEKSLYDDVGKAFTKNSSLAGNQKIPRNNL